MRVSLIVDRNLSFLLTPNPSYNTYPPPPIMLFISDGRAQLAIELDRCAGYRTFTPHKRMIVSRTGSAFGTASTRQLRTVVPSLLSLEVTTPEKKSTLGSCHRLTSGSWYDAARFSCDSPNTSRRSALGASNVCLVGENQRGSVPAL